MKNYLMIEEPDDKAVVVDYMGQYPVQVKLTLTAGQLHVYIMEGEYPNKILEDNVYVVSEADFAEKEAEDET